MRVVQILTVICLLLTVKSLEIEGFTIFEDKVLGEGNFGTVYRGIEDETAKEVAIKTIKMEKAKNDMQIKSENAILQHLAKRNAKYVLNTLKIVENKDEEGNLTNVYQIFPMMTYDLKDIMGRTFADNELHFNRIGYYLLKGLRNIHRQGIFHLDMKADNILLDDNLIPYICDFGLSRKATGKKRKGSPGTPGYKSPEQMIDKAYYGDKSDVWGMGVILFRLFTGRRPIKVSKLVNKNSKDLPKEEIKVVLKEFEDSKAEMIDKFKYNIGIDWANIILGEMMVPEERRVSSEELVDLVEEEIVELGLEEKFKNLTYKHEIESKNTNLNSRENKN